METTKKLVMVFKTDGERNVSLSVDNPIDNLQESTIKTVMQLIIDKNVFEPNAEALVSLVEARIVVTNTSEYALA